MAKTKKIICLIALFAVLLGAFALTGCKKDEDKADDTNKTVEYSFNISKTEMSLEVGESEKLECRYGDKKIVFVTSDEAVATVSEDGTVSAVSVGTAYVTAKADGIAGAEKICKVIVSKTEYAVTLSVAGNINAVKGAAIEFTASVLKNGGKSDLVATYTVSGSGATVVTDGNVSRITFGAAGEYVVKAEYQGAAVTVTVTVTYGVA